jgi:hypothetical protein
LCALVSVRSTGRARSARHRFDGAVTSWFRRSRNARATVDTQNWMF